MSQSENKPKLSDIARQTNADKAKRFGSTMIPSPPPVTKVQTPPVEETVAPESTTVEETPTVKVTQEKPELAANPAPSTSPKPARTRRSGPLTLEDVITADAPKGEQYPRQVRIAERHHKLLRKLAFTYDVTINHVMYNLLEVLDQADQRDQQKGD